MSAEDFQLIDNSKSDESNIKRDFIKLYHHHGAEVNNDNQNIKIYLGENLNYKQIGNGNLEVDIELKKVDNTIFTNVDQIRLVNNGLAYMFQESQLSTSSGTQIENNRHLGPVSRIMRLLTQKDRDLSSCFHKIDEGEAGITNSSLKLVLIDSHTNDDNKGKKKLTFLSNIFLVSVKHLKK